MTEQDAFEKRVAEALLPFAKARWIASDFDPNDRLIIAQATDFVVAVCEASVPFDFIASGDTWRAASLYHELTQNSSDLQADEPPPGEACPPLGVPSLTEADGVSSSLGESPTPSAISSGEGGE